MHTEQVGGDHPPLSAAELDALMKPLPPSAPADEAQGQFVEVIIKERDFYRDTLLVALGRATEAGLRDLAEYLKLAIQKMGHYKADREREVRVSALLKALSKEFSGD